ncbi:MAG: hypothetical protein HS104_42450 [Polyangiaceae bacterium]|nr:hypothetical protein [Polyangiaceae bacterium]MCE7894958.1 hypothetical protein [Sorangiineae bacterium PRO1]MCL4756646.1 hypothetical protein [Myxococcales bacterium]
MLERDGRVIDGELSPRARRRVGENTRPGFRLRAPRACLGARRRSARTHRGKSLRSTTLASNVSFGARDYDPTVGRWTAQDPLRRTGGHWVESYRSGAYSYADGDPINLFDFDGRKVSQKCMDNCTPHCVDIQHDCVKKEKEKCKKQKQKPDWCSGGSDTEDDCDKIAYDLCKEGHLGCIKNCEEKCEKGDWASAGP